MKSPFLILRQSRSFTRLLEDSRKVTWCCGLTVGDWYTVWPMVEADLFSLQDEKKHSARRRNVANAYSLSTLLGMEQYVDECSTLLLREFSKLAAKGDPVDISGWLQYYAFDVVGELGTPGPTKLIQASVRNSDSSKLARISAGSE